MQKNTVDNDLHMLREEISTFVAERDWKKFNTPKNLATALCVEAAELLEPFQWLQSGTPDELGADKLTEVRREIADVQIYLISLAASLDIDIKDAVLEKIAINRVKYPADKVRGSARKYTEYE